jgi:signal transduction histidine kinase
MTQRTLPVEPSAETIVPLNTAVNLLRIMLTVKILPDVISLITLGLGSSSTSALILLTSWPTALVWAFVMLPRIDRRLGRYYLPLCLVLTVAAQSTETGLSAFAFLPRSFSPRFAAPERQLLPGDIRGLEPLFLLLVATVLASWAYGRRGAWRTTGLVAVLLLIGNWPDLTSESPTRALAESSLRITLLLVVGWIVGTLAEQERRQTAALSEANAKLREQAAAVEELAAARERNRLARDLHDTLAHSLAGLVVQLGAIDTLMYSEPDAARAEIATARRAAHAGLEEARRAIRDLRANPVEDLGLARALERMAVDFGERAGVKVEARVSDPRAAIPGDTAAAIWRIAQEALNNVERHADARQVSLTLAQNNGALALTVTDDGRGFDAANVDDDRFGLTGMRERAELIGATLQVDSGEGLGTSVRLMLPLT